MGGGSSSKTKSNQQTSTQSNTGPYAPTQGALQNIINAGQRVPVVNGASPLQKAADTGIQNVTNYAANNFIPQQEGLVNSLYQGGGVKEGLPYITGSYNQEAQTLNPMLQSAWLNPQTNPYFNPALDALNEQIRNGVAGQFGGGNQNLFDPSGQFGKALGLGLAQGEAPILQNQFNTQVGQAQQAAQQLAQSGYNAGQGVNNINYNASNLGMQAMNTAGNSVTPYSTQLGLAQQMAAQPFTNPQAAANFFTPIAALGTTGQSSGTQSGTSTTQTYTNPIQAAAGVGIGGVGLLGGTGAFGPNGWLSDRRFKEDIEQVGALYDGTPVYRFRYVKDGAMVIGLMSDEVVPEAVREYNGVEFVDYEKATQGAIDGKPR